MLAIVILTGTSAFADTLTICKDCPIHSIQMAIDLANDYDVLEVQRGNYKEYNIRVNKKLKIMGVDWPIVDAQNQGEIFTIVSDSVTIIGLQIQNVGTSYIKDRAGINIDRVDGCVVSGNRLYNTFFGIYLKKSRGCIIENNEIIGEALQEMSSGNAIQLWYCKNIQVRNNRVSKHRDGIYLEFVDDSIIEDNRSSNNLRYGLHFMFSNNDEYKGNVFESNGAGVAVMFSKNIIMQKNKFMKNWGGSAYGLLLKEIYDGEIIDNIFMENTIGIYAESANRLLISGNEFSNNGWALKILGSSMDNSFTANNFIGNTFDLSTNSSRNENKYDGNYWSQYAGYDLDKDGLGDVPYRPVKLFSYVTNRVDASIILLRSLFIDLIDFAEKVAPVFTPTNLFDHAPLMKPSK